MGFMWSVLFLLSAHWSLGISQEGGISWFVHLSDLHISEFEDASRGPDLEDLASSFLSILKPELLVVTGDLTDSKTSYGRAKQIPQEWTTYRQVMDSVRNSTGLAWKDVLDVRGNHDTFDVPHRSHPRDYFSKFAASAGYWVNSRIRLTPLFEPGQAGGMCAVAWLVGVDLSPEPGLRGPTNFVGFAQDVLVSDLDKALTDLRSTWVGGCEPVVIVFGHYPLGFVAYQFQDYWGINGFNSGYPTLESVFLKHGVAAYLCGHLHEKFGRQLHRVVTSDGRSFAELETADWKFSRRLRIVVVSGGDLSFVDLIYCPGGNDSSTKSFWPEDRDMIIGRYVAVVASPASAYYSPLGSGPSRGFPSLFRALVVPVEGNSDGQVYLTWFCNGGKNDSSGKVEMRSRDARKTVYEIERPATMQCQGRFVTVRVEVEEKGKFDSASGFIRVHLGMAYAPMIYPHTLKEKFTLSTMWVQSARLLFSLVWFVHTFGLLIIPRLLCSNECFAFAAFKTLEKSTEVKGTKNATFLLSLGSLVQICVDATRGLALHWVQRVCWASQATAFWIGELVFCMYILLGPWAVLNTLEDYPPCILFRFGIWCPALPAEELQFISGSHMLMICCFHYLFTVFPAFVWKIWVVSSWQEESQVTKPFNIFTLLLQCVMGLVISGFHMFLLSRLWKWYGLSALFFSPAIGWFGPISFFCLMSAQKDAKKLRTD